jgi:dihydropteroate synthase
VDAAVAAGVDERQILLDPGLGFAKLPPHDLALLRHLDQLTALRFPVLVGASRKRFLGAVLAGPGGAPPPRQRDAATLATTVLAARAGAWGVRVHDVAGTVDAVRVVAAVG